MILNQNEKYLLKFISSNNKDNDLLEVVYKLGIKLKFSDYNPIYQIIDEMAYGKYYTNR